MAQGIRLPARGKLGRLEKIYGEDYIRQLIITALRGAESTNPFQDIGLGEFMIFEINDGVEQGKIQKRIELIFASLESDQLAKLDNPKTDLVFKREGEELFADITYTDMETQERKLLSVPIPAGE